MNQEILDAVQDMQAYPNPFSTAAVVEITLPENGKAQLDLYNGQGKLVQAIFSGNVEGDLPYTFEVFGHDLPAGSYTARLTTSSGTQNVELVLVK